MTRITAWTTRGTSMNPARFESFALAYAPAILLAAKAIGVHVEPDESIEDYALRTTLDMLDMIQAKGIESVQRYYLNTHGGAFRITCKALGLPDSTQALKNYLEGE